MSVLRALEGQDRNFGTNPEADAQTEADPLVDVEDGVVDLVEAGGETASLGAQRKAAQAREVDLAAVGVAGKHQIAAAAVQVLNGRGIVGQQHARHGGGQIGKSLVQVADAAPEVLDPGQVQVLTATRQNLGLIVEHPDALGFEGVGNRPVEMAMAADAQGVADGKIMIAQDGVDAVRGLQPAENPGDLLDVAKTLVDEIACENDDIGALGQGEIDGLGEIGRGDLAAAVKIGHLHDAEAVEQGRQIGNGDEVLVELQPGGLDAGGVSETGPVAA